MFILSCHFCGVEFAAKTARKKWCSFNCNSLARGFDCSECGKRMHVSRSVADSPRCKDCRKPTHGSVSMYTAGCRCDDCKVAQAEEARIYYAKRKADGRPLSMARRTVDRNCEGCGVVFQARRDTVRVGGGRFCSIQCVSVLHKVEGSRNDKARERHREFGKQGSVRWRALRRAKAALELTGKGTVYVQGPCAACGEQFTGIGAFARYCSDECRAKYSTRDNFGIRWLDRMWMYARDDWACHLCGLEVIYAVDGYDPRAATLDHIVPRALGGGHEFENLRTAHSLCNSIRQDRPVDEFRSDEAVAMLRSRLGDAMEVAA